MSRKNRIVLFFLLPFAFLPCAALAQIGGNGWKSYAVKFNVQSPTNAPQSQRYFVTNAPLPTYHCLVYSNDGAFSVGNTTKPRTEQRFTPDYTNGEIQYQAMLMCPSNENSYCCFQIHTGDAQSSAYGSTTFMIFWFTNSGGSVHDYSGTTLATGLGNKWFQLNFDHNMVTRQMRVWVNGKQVWAQEDNGAGDFYMKDGVYEQDHNPTYQMDTYITNILMWTNIGVNPPPAPTNLVASPTATKIPLTWATAWDQTNFTFNVKRATTSGGPYTTLTNLHGTTWTDTNVVAGATYYYAVSAIDQFGESSNSMRVATTLIYSPTPMPVHIFQNGTNLIFSGSNGTANAQYHVLASTNISLPRANWTIMATNNFDGSGNFDFTNPADPNAPQMFYLMQLK
jgi:hypothetical protein